MWVPFPRCKGIAPGMTAMADTSLTARVAPIAAGAHVVSAAFLGRVPVLALADGALLFCDIGKERRIEAHSDATLLVAASDAMRIVTGDDAGRVIATDASGAQTPVAEMGGKWIDALALHPDGAVAWSAGKEVRVRDAKGAVKQLSVATSARGLAFMPKGFRLAIAQYHGVALWFPNAAAKPDFWEWKGSHLDVTVSRDGRFVITSMQENSLHGWRASDQRNMKMTGYPAKSRSTSWSHDGQWLATSGAEACIVWPFSDKDGPMGKAPRETGVRPARVSRVAFHPAALVVAIGYEDGWVMLSRLTDASEILVRAPGTDDGAGAITALAWDAEGKRLLFGAADGAAGLLGLP